MTKAYDICPQMRVGNEASQAMLILGQDRMSRLATCLEAAVHFQLDAASAESLIAKQIEGIRAYWASVAQEAGLSEIEQGILRGRVFFNPYIFEDAPERLQAMQPD
ncbi:hypothetical protein [Trinickia violacea]|uniref:hypothetical protein n=1 Tax=Trinickia violacea TaxID=2571746 RepID=UPI001C300021|nr:hypothetical protein [Trinickia violacea]